MGTRAMDPKRLLDCLSVVLLPNGGIKSTNEVERLAKLMIQYSRKLVSKCIYIQILKSTETSLLNIFMGSGGWRLVHMWLSEGIEAKNWPLIKELLELLLLCPVDIDRLKTNNCPKLVKELSKDENHYEIRAFASKLVEQWLKTVKGEQSQPVLISDIPKIGSDNNTGVKSEDSSGLPIETMNSNDKIIINSTTENDVPNNIDEKKYNNVKAESVPDKNNDMKEESELLPVLKITLKNGKQILTKADVESKSSVKEKDKTEVKNKSKSKDKSIEKRSSDSSKSSSSKYLSKSKSSIDKNNSHKDSSSKHSSSSNSKDKKRDRDKHSSSSSHSSKSKSSSSSSSNSSKKSSSPSSKSKEDKNSQKSTLDKEKSKEKESKEERERREADKEQKILDSEVKPQIPSIHKLGRIPKLSDVKRDKPSISIEVRKPEDPKPKTVKTFHSRFRKHGLEEEIQPPPSRASVVTKNPLSPSPQTVSIPKRPSPIHSESPPEKKSKTIDIIDKPGAIKLIPPKPKPIVLQESDLFMDALNASATNKKEPKKRKKRTSTDSSPPQTPTNIENKSVPPRFYQDTLDEEESKKNLSQKEVEINENVEKINNIDDVEEKMDETEPHTRTVNGLKGVLCYHKRKGPKKSIRWKPSSELEEIKYFELDETERVNVAKKTFTDMKHLERINERDAFQKATNLTNDDVMEEKTSWKPLIFVDCGDQVQVDYGKNSKEKDIQAIRQKGTLQPLYFHKAMIPDSPFEPDRETHTYSEAMTIPLDDLTGNVSDFRNMPWPDPKGNPPPTTNNNINIPQLFSPNISQFHSHFPPIQFPTSGFQGPPILAGDWQNNLPTSVISNGLSNPMISPVMPPSSMAGSMPPSLMAPPDNIIMGAKIFGGPNQMFPCHPDGFNMPQNVFPDDFTMSAGPIGPPVSDSFTGPGNYRFTMRGRAANEHWRGKTNGNFDGPPRGRGGSRGGRKAVCIHFQRKGSCRQGNNCSFLHPGVNCPY